VGMSLLWNYARLGLGMRLEVNDQSGLWNCSQSLVHGVLYVDSVSLDNNHIVLQVSLRRGCDPFLVSPLPTHRRRNWVISMPDCWVTRTRSKRSNTSRSSKMKMPVWNWWVCHSSGNLSPPGLLLCTEIGVDDIQNCTVGIYSMSWLFKASPEN